MIAFFAVNDVSDREPIVQDETLGYTRGKGRSGFLPAGPWLVPGTDLMPTTKEGGSQPVELELAVRRGGTANAGSAPRRRA